MMSELTYDHEEEYQSFLDRSFMGRGFNKFDVGSSYSIVMKMYNPDKYRRGYLDYINSAGLRDEG